MLKSLTAIAGCALAVLAAGTVSAEAYKWVDAQGQVHYSDRPPPAGAQKVELIPVQTYRAPASTRAAASTEPAKPGAAVVVAYSEFELRKPQTGEVIQNSGGTVSVELRISPALQPGHSIWLYLDGKRIDGLSTKATSFELSGVWRGEHQLVAAVTEASGKSVVSTPPVSFMVRQTSVAKPPQGPALRPSTGSKP